MEVWRQETRTFSSQPFFPPQRGDSFVTEDCSQRCTCVSSEHLLCEPLGCSDEEICTLGNLTRGCFRGEPRSPLGFQLPPYLRHPRTEDCLSQSYAWDSSPSMPGSLSHLVPLLLTPFLCQEGQRLRT